MKRFALPAVMLAIALAYPFVFQPGGFQLIRLEAVAAMVIVAIGLNLVLGQAGQMFLGPSAVFGISAYAVGVAAVHQPWLGNLWLMLGVGLIAGVVSGLVLGVPALRFGGFYLGMATLYVAAVLPVISQRIAYIGGSSGISLIADLNFHQTYTDTTLYVAAVLVVGLVAIVAWLITESRVGRRFRLLATSEELASSLGVSGYRTKLLAFVIGSAIIGVGGGLYVHTQQFVSPSSTSATLSILLLASCVIGGLGRVDGAVLGALLTFGFTVFVRDLERYEGIAFGCLIIVVMIVRPEGLLGALPPRRPRRIGVSLERGTAPPAPARPRVAASFSARGLERRFGSIAAVDDVDIDVGEGKVVGLVGPNGSGKTTTLNLVSGHLLPSAGRMQLGDHRVAAGRAAAVARRGVQRTFQTPKLVTGSTVRDNLTVAAEQVVSGSGIGSVLRLPAARRVAREIDDLVHAWLEYVELGDEADLPAGNLSHGSQRLVELARAMLLGGSLVLLDEPAAGLSPAEVTTVKRAVRDLSAEGTAVLIVEHNLPIVYDLASDVTVLDHGRVLAKGSPDEIAANEDVARVYLGGGLNNAAADVDRRTLGATRILEVVGLHAGYGPMTITSDVDLEVRAGELVALVGRNGAGKTTTLAAIAGVRHGSNSGTIELHGRRIDNLAPWHVAAAGVALVPEGRRIFTRMTVGDNLRMAAGIGRANRREIDAEIERVIQLFPALEKYANTIAGSLSGGEQQMVAVAQALVSRPKVLLLDEPSAGLAPVLVDELFNTLLRLRDDGLGILVVDQNVERVLNIADRAYLMEGGTVTLGGHITDAAIATIIDTIVGADLVASKQEQPT